MNRYKLILIFSSLFFIGSSFGQPNPSSSEEIASAIDSRKSLAEESFLKNYPIRNVGPVVQGGRIADMAVHPSNNKIFYVAYASGGVFKTVNNGVTFLSIFDNVGHLTAGAIALAPSSPDVLYVGTGENNSSRSSYAGSGVYKSNDGGESWAFSGLGGVQHTGRIVVHPSNPDIVWVASIGNLYSHDSERGVFKSNDGGKSWSKTLFINDSTGVIDLIINPTNPDQLFATAWERTRKAWNFKGNGPGSGIYRSNDGGENWEKTTNGLPGEDVEGRWGVAISDSSPNILYAVLDNQGTTEKEEKDDDESLTFKKIGGMSQQEFLAYDEEKLNKFFENNGFPQKYNAELVKTDIRSGKYTISDIANYQGDANQALFNTQVIGAEVYKSNDGGSNWNKVSEILDGVYFTYGYYFGQIRISPQDPNRVFIMGVPFLRSDDGGKTFSRADSVTRVHADHHSLWIDPEDHDHMMLGNDGGLYITYDGGAYWDHINNTSVAQFYTVNVDMQKPYHIYGGLQDNGTLEGSSKSVPNKTPFWERVFGGDGMFVAPDPRNSDIVLTGFQFGNYFKVNRANGSRKRITPSHDIGEPKLRYNWRTPMIRSIHNADIIYTGAQKVYRSLDHAETWAAISPDLTKDKPQGNVPYSTIATIAESPLQFGMLYVGSDDGLIHLSKDGGGSWQDITGGLPQDLWVSSIAPSPHDVATVFVTLTGYRSDDFHSYVYKSTDYGTSWARLKGNLPEECANIIIQDPVSNEILYLGTDHATYVSMDQGNQWHLLSAVPNVATYDLVVHPRDNELVIGTHGRGIYVMDVKPLQQLKTKKADALVAWGPESIRWNENWGEKRFSFSKPSDPKATLAYWANTNGNTSIEILNAEGDVIRSLEGSSSQGYHTIVWDLKVNKKSSKKKRKKADDQEESAYVVKGKYKIKFNKGSFSQTIDFEVKE